MHLGQLKKAPSCLRIRNKYREYISSLLIHCKRKDLAGPTNLQKDCFDTHSLNGYISIHTKRSFQDKYSMLALINVLEKSNKSSVSSSCSCFVIMKTSRQNKEKYFLWPYFKKTKCPNNLKLFLSNQAIHGKWKEWVKHIFEVAYGHLQNLNICQPHILHTASIWFFSIFFYHSHSTWNILQTNSWWNVRSFRR